MQQTCQQLQVFATMYFRKTPSNNFSMCAYIINTEITKTNKSFFGAKSILGHETANKPIIDHASHKKNYHPRDKSNAAKS